MDSVTQRISQLRAAIAAQDELRPLLGDAAVDVAVDALRSRLESLLAEEALASDGIPPGTRIGAGAGGSTGEADRSTMRATAGSERRDVSVLFADLSGFTALSERLDPEVIRAFQGDLFDELTAVIREYEGFVEKFVGDAVLAIFGAPHSHEDDPERALRAALAIRERMDLLDRRWADRLGVSTSLHIGVNTGTVVAGQIGSESGGAYAVTGDTITTASRLQTAARPNQILVSAATQRLTHEAFVFRALKPIRVKGKREPLVVFELQRVRVRPGKSRGLAGLSAPMVGRDEKLAELRRVTDELPDRGGRVVVVTGEVGIGKSRLMAEWSATLDPEVRWLEGHCFAHGAALPYGPFLDLCRRYAGITDDDSERRARVRLRDTLDRVLPGDLEANAIVAGMLGMRPQPDEVDFLGTLSSRDLGQRLIALIETIFTRLAEQRPTVLVLEDLHWADDSSIELIERLVRLTERLPLAIVAIFRSGPTESPLQRALMTGAGERLSHVDLHPLSEESTVQLAAELLAIADLPPAARKLIVVKAEGNPFFVEEVIRSLIESGALVRAGEGEGDGWTSTALIDSVTVPDTLRGVLMARLDRLPDARRRVVQQAAVIGRLFPFRVLLKLSERPGDLEQDLADLERQELIYELRRVPEVEYIFKHALTQEVAYESLLSAQRRDLHERVGSAIEELFADRIGEFHSILGGHFLRGEAWQQASSHFAQAGDAATRLHAHPEGRLQYAAALEALSHVAATAETNRRIVDLTLSRVAVSWGAEDPGHNLARLAAVEDLALALAGDATSGPDRVRLARVHYWMGRMHYYRGAPREAIGYFQQVLAIGQELGDEELLAIPSAVMGRAVFLQGHFGKAAGLLARAVEPLEASQDWQEWAYTDAFLGVALAARGEYRRGSVECERALARARATENHTAVAGCLSTFCFLRMLERDWAGVSDAGRATAAAAERAGNPLLIYTGLGWEAWGTGRSGDLAAADVLLGKMQAVAQSIGGRLVIADWFAAAGAELALAGGRADRAVTLAEEAVGLARAVGGIFGEGLSERVWGRALASLDPSRLEEAEGHLQRSLELFESGDCHVEVAHTNLAWGTIRMERGDIARAVELLRLAATRFESAGLEGPLAEARTWLAQTA
jgi:class 3 adenylate cyclase/tetratricopeptide (TPR) repeat protein